MKKFIVLLLVLILMGTILFSEIVINKDKPLRGEWDFHLKKVWETDSAGDNPLVQTTNIHVDDSGNVFLFDRKFYKFIVFDKNGKFLYTFGERGEGPGQYRMIFSFFLVGNSIIATDQLQMHVYTKKGKHIKSYKMRSYLFPITFLDKNRFVTFPYDPYKKNKYAKLQIFNLNTFKSNIIAEILAEKEISATDNGGMFSFSDKYFTPTILVAKHKNSLYICRSSKYSIRKTDFNGKELLSFSIPDRKQKRFSTDIKKKRVSRVKRHGAELPNSMVRKLIKSMPDYSPIFTDILIDDNGLVYVFLNNVFDKKNQEIDIFLSNGKYLYKSQLKFSEEFVLLNQPLVKGNALYVFVEINEGERKLIKYYIKRPLVN